MVSLNHRRIKWSYATRVLGDLPEFVGDLAGRLELGSERPQANDVLVAEVVEIGRHSKLELPAKRAATLFPGDVIGLAFGHRYATRQFEGSIPSTLETCHILCVGGVCGEVIGMAAEMQPPTTLRALGFLLGEDQKRVNLERHGLKPANETSKVFGGATTILVVGSSMDSGKTTAAYSIVHGLSRSGASVCAAKLTGTASAKDPLIMEDAGALKVLDFTDMGHASTAMCSREQLWNIVRTAGTNLASRCPDYIVLEIADGIVQRETKMLLEMLADQQVIHHVIYTCNDSLGVSMGVSRLREYGFNVSAVSGWVGCSPLAAQEAQAQTDLPVLRPEQLRDPAIANMFDKNGSGEIVAERAQDNRVILSFPSTRLEKGLATGTV